MMLAANMFDNTDLERLLGRRWPHPTQQWVVGISAHVSALSPYSLKPGEGGGVSLNDIFP